MADINPDTAGKTAAEIGAAGGIACAIKLDVTSLQDATVAAEAVERQLGPLDIWLTTPDGTKSCIFWTPTKSCGTG